MGIVFWLLIIVFGVLFMGWEYFLYVFLVMILFLILKSYFPNWFNGI